MKIELKTRSDGLSKMSSQKKEPADKSHLCCCSRELSELRAVEARRERLDDAGVPNWTGGWKW